MLRSVFSRPTSIQAFRKNKVADGMVVLLTLLACRTWHPLQVAVGSPNGGPSDTMLESCQRNAVQTSIDRDRKSHKRILDIGRDPSISAFSSDYRRRHNNPSFCHVGENVNRHGDHRLARKNCPETEYNNY